MRQIKFRGKRVDNGEWVYGHLYQYQGKMRISNEFIEHPTSSDPAGTWIYHDNEVDPATVSQFTGLLDKNGKEIYEGDLLRDEHKDDWDKINFTCYEVFFHDGNANMDYNIGYSIARTHHHGSICGGYIPSFKPKSVSKMIVCGNLHDSPSLTNH